jgi:hypothetical protein
MRWICLARGFARKRAQHLALTLVLGLGAQPALAELYECRIRGENSWVPKVIVIEVGGQGDTVKVFDPLIKYFVGKPLNATVDTDNSARTTFSWGLQVKSDSNQYARLKVRLTRLKADASASVTVQALDYVGPFTGRGSCETVKGRL